MVCTIELLGAAEVELVGAGQGTFEQFGEAIADHASDVREGEFAQGEGSTHVIDRGGNVGQRVDERAVQIEK